ncbi:hypothetical protein ACVW16_000544 [Bradyrhizobium sp. USDA 4474]
MTAAERGVDSEGDVATEGGVAKNDARDGLEPATSGVTGRIGLTISGLADTLALLKLHADSNKCQDAQE